MKIAFLSKYQNVLERGAEIFVKELSSRLSKKHQVDILSADTSMNKILSGSFNVVIPINGGMQALKAAFGRLFKRYKLIISGQGGIGRGELWNLLVARPDVYVALTDDMRSWASKWAWGVEVVKIPNGVDLNKFSSLGATIKINLPKPIVLSVGALTWYKHHERTIMAMHKINNGSLLIVGEGPLKISLEKLGKKLLGERFKISSFKHEDMPAVYRSCDLFTLPSWEREAFGIVYLEAMASGLPVVAPDDASRQEIVGEGGILTDVSDAEKYAEVVRQALSVDLSEKARKQAEKFSWDKIAEDYEKIILI